MRLLINILIILSVGFLLGGYSASYLIQRTHGFGAISVGPWSAWPFIGGREIDPYTAAKVIADGTIPLGAAEGLSFEAASDEFGVALNQDCHYVIAGKTSATQLWTLAAYDAEGNLVLDEDDRISAIFSGNIIRFPDGSFKVNISHIPLPGNWVPLGREGNFRLIMRLYDTPITSNSGLVAPTMPRIERQDCLS